MIRELIADIGQTIADLRAQEVERKCKLAELQAQEQRQAIELKERRAALYLTQEANERQRHLVILSSILDKNGNVIITMGDARETMTKEVSEYNPMTGRIVRQETMVPASVVCMPQIGLRYDIRLDSLTIDGRPLYGAEAAQALQLVRGHTGTEEQKYLPLPDDKSLKEAWLPDFSELEDGQ
jgi:hypothetical protein